jgi:hypothetical protein
MLFFSFNCFILFNNFFNNFFFCWFRSIFFQYFWFFSLCYILNSRSFFLFW